MTIISGIEIEKNEQGQEAFIRIDLKKYGKQLQSFLREVGIAEDDEFERKWRTGLTKEELLKQVFEHIDTLPWKK